MEEVTVAVENYFSDAGFEGFFSDCFAHGSSDFDFGALFDAFGGGGNKGFAGEVVDELYVDLFVATEDSHAGTGSSAGDAAAAASLDFISSVLEIMMVSIYLFGTGSLAGFTTNNFANKLDTFALVGFGLTQGADLGTYLAQELLVVAGEDNQRVFVTF